MTDMELMVTYSTELLAAISAWLLRAPMIYFVGALVGCFVINMILSICGLNRRN